MINNTMVVSENIDDCFVEDLTLTCLGEIRLKFFLTDTYMREKSILFTRIVLLNKNDKLM